MQTSAIEWTEATWNPTTGCDRISPGCDNCYALTLAKRLQAMDSPKYQRDGDPRTSGPGFGVTVHDAALTAPLRWRRPRRVFVNSMSDLGHARIPRDRLAAIFAVMALGEQHTFQVLSKRPNRLRAILTNPKFEQTVHAEEDRLRQDHGLLKGSSPPRRWPAPNVWLGTSIESNVYSWRADELRASPAATRFLSLEPLLGPLPSLDLAGIDWVIVGGESGPRFRPLDLDWVRDIRDRCVAQGVPLFFKQIGGRTPKAGGRLLDGRTWDEYPVAARQELANGAG